MQSFVTTLRDSELVGRRVVLLALLYLIPSFQAMLPIDDTDIWWRLRTGQWIVANHTVPVKDFISPDTTGKLWIEYGWSFQALVYALHARFGLLGLVYFMVAMSLIIAFVAHQLVRRAGLPLPFEVALVGLALAAMKPLMTPRPWLFTIVFFSLELTIIAQARQSEKSRLLWFLPLLFFFWANLHIQFIYGLAALGLLLAEVMVTSFWGWGGYQVAAPQLSFKPLLLVSLACIGVTLATPYHLLLYKQIFEYAAEAGTFQYVTELHPMFFRSLDNWITLLLTLAAAFILGWQRKWLPYATLLLLMGVFVAFRARRDVWVLVLVAIWIISDSFRSSFKEDSERWSAWQIAVSAVVVACALYFVSLSRGISEEQLQIVVENKFPVRAVEYIKANQLSGPLFNDFTWGGFLSWSLREIPPSIDGRTNLYGDKATERSVITWEGRPGWDTNPELLRARLIVANRDAPLTSLLRVHPRYKTIYQDDVAFVIIPIR
jgi:hypothetical protein